MQELDELRKKLGNVTASSNAPLVSVSHSHEVALDDLVLMGSWIIMKTHTVFSGFLLIPSGVEKCFSSLLPVCFGTSEGKSDNSSSA